MFGAACDVYDPPSGAMAGSGGDNGGNPELPDGTLVGEAGGSGTGGAHPLDASTGGGPASDAPSGNGIALPFTVDAYFIPSGSLGDGVVAGSVTVETSCKLPRPTGAMGNCYSITYKPQPPESGPAWAGLYWQFPRGNWGLTRGKKVAPGASKVTFWAACGTGQELVTFRAGGIQSAGFPYQDGFKVEQDEQLTTTLTRYSIDISGQPYDEVIGAFAWVINVTDSARWALGAAPIVLYLDDIRWEP
jgi:hypothetical protein